MLKVFNILGQEVATIVDESKSVGSHTSEFDASGPDNCKPCCTLKRSTAVGSGPQICDEGSPGGEKRL